MMLAKMPLPYGNLTACTHLRACAMSGPASTGLKVITRALVPKGA